MKYLWKFFEYGYLIIAVIFGVETFLNWNVDRNRAYMLLGFTFVAVFMYFFRKRFRKRLEERKKN